MCQNIHVREATGMNHYTNKKGYDGIRSAPTWLFRAIKPRKATNPKGAYFTPLPPSDPLLAARIGVSREKLSHIFAFVDQGDLHALGSYRPHANIFYSTNDYPVGKDRQTKKGATGL